MTALPGQRTVAEIVATLERSPAAAGHVRMARELGYAFVDVDSIPDIGVAQLDHRRRRLEVLSGAEYGVRVSMSAHELRHVRHAEEGILDLLDRVPPEDHLGALCVMEADAIAFQVHVGAEMIQRGDPAIWRNLTSQNVYGPAADAYLGAVRRGKSASFACAKAFEALSFEDEFLDTYEEVARIDPPGAGGAQDPAAMGTMVSLIRASDPTGARYEARLFRDGVERLVRKAAARVPSAAAPTP